jgi:hypothetical protein
MRLTQGKLCAFRAGHTIIPGLRSRKSRLLAVLARHKAGRTRS